MSRRHDYLVAGTAAVFVSLVGAWIINLQVEAQFGTFVMTGVLSVGIVVAVLGFISTLRLHLVLSAVLIVGAGIMLILAGGLLHTELFTDIGYPVESE